MSEVTQECPPPRELNFIEHALDWLESISQEDANKFLNGITLDSALVLYKHFPDNQLVKEVLQSKI
jgi:hypothetical protein